ncbi:hypothetical protein [Sphingobium aromaticiconvertens]|uniref:hypothetical protein n=1 Tax=Sphingobium aromaticiconvertens TaxID=365341 RepID=UPI0030168452
MTFDISLFLLIHEHAPPNVGRPHGKKATLAAGLAPDTELSVSKPEEAIDWRQALMTSIIQQVLNLVKWFACI